MASLMVGQPTESIASSSPKRLLVQTKTELILTMRRGESILITLIIPSTLLVFFTSLHILPGSTEDQVSWYLPSMLAIAIMSTGMVSLGIATAYERHYGVIKRLGVSPLSRFQLLLAKIISVLCIECVQTAFLVAIAVLYGWRPTGNIFAISAILIAGTCVFASLGLLMAGVLRAEITLALANALYLFTLLGSGGLVPLNRFPGIVEAVASWLPGSALTSTLQSSMHGAAVPMSAVLILCGWGILFLAAAVSTFRWE